MKSTSLVESFCLLCFSIITQNGLFFVKYLVNYTEYWGLIACKINVFCLKYTPLSHCKCVSNNLFELVLRWKHTEFLRAFNIGSISVWPQLSNTRNVIWIVDCCKPLVIFRHNGIMVFSHNVVFSKSTWDISRIRLAKEFSLILWPWQFRCATWEVCIFRTVSQSVILKKMKLFLIGSDIRFPLTVLNVWF